MRALLMDPGPDAHGAYRSAAYADGHAHWTAHELTMTGRQYQLDAVYVPLSRAGRAIFMDYQQSACALPPLSDYWRKVHEANVQGWAESDVTRILDAWPWVDDCATHGDMGHQPLTVRGPWLCCLSCGVVLDEV